MQTIQLRKKLAEASRERSVKALQSSLRARLQLLRIIERSKEALASPVYPFSTAPKD